MRPGLTARVRVCVCVQGIEAPPLQIRLIGHHSLWAHCLWNASVVLSRFIDQGQVAVRGRSVLELGAGAAVPSIVAALNGATHVRLCRTNTHHLTD